MAPRNQIFVSYSHKDRELFEEFKTMMAPAIGLNIVDLWDDERSRPAHELRLDRRRAGFRLGMKSDDYQ